MENSEYSRSMELNVPKDVADSLMRQLEQLESSTDLEGTAIVSKTGLRVASGETSDTVADIYSASPATLISLGQKISSNLEQGKLKEIVIQGSKGYTIIMLGRSDFMLFTNCKKGYKLGYYFHKIRKSFKDMEDILEQLDL